jgi:hypothetical protein
MTIEDFWKLIDTIDRLKLQSGEGYDQAAIDPLIATLATLSRSELESFQDHLAQALYDLDTQERADASEGSDDSFLYSRCYVVAMGRETYQRTLRDPASMPNSLDAWCEPLLYAASVACVRQTGEELHYITKVSFETGSNVSRWRKA